MKVALTQYGPSKKSGGWDPDGDDSTDRLEGDWGFTINTDTVAVADCVRAGIPAKPGDWLHIDLRNGTAPLVRQIRDRAPEQGDPSKPFYVSNPWRVDLYMLAFDPTLPDWAEVTLLTVDP